MSSVFNIGPDRIRDALQFIPPDERELWVTIGMAVKSSLGDDEGFDLWNSWSEGGATYNERDAQSVWKSITPRDGGPTAGTLFHHAREHGWRPPARAVSRTLPALRSPKSVRDDGEPSRKARTAALVASQLWAAAGPSEGHPYICAKGLAPHAGLRQIGLAEAAVILGYTPKASGEPLTGPLLVAPVTVDGSLSTAELIGANGRKSAIAGGVKASGYWATRPLPTDLMSADTVLIGEGVATALSAAEASGLAALAALSIGNLSAVATKLRAKYPHLRIVVLAELNKETGAVDPRSHAAALVAGGEVAVPDFGAHRSSGAKDFNDLHTLRGATAVVTSIGKAARPAAAAEAWPAPQPISATIEVEPFPMDALPARIRAAVDEVGAFVQAPPAMVVTSALAAVSVAAQAHVDVQRAVGLSGPVSLFFMTVADSGERKTSLDRHFTNRIRQYEQAQRELAKPLLKTYVADHAAWTAERDGLLSAIKEAARKSKPSDALRRDLQQLEQDEPEEPRYPQLLMMDETPESLAFKLAKKWPSGGIFSSEGGTVLGAHGMGKDTITRNLALQNVLWDGGSLPIGRKTSETFTLRNARLTTALQVQEAPLRSFLEKSDGLARGTGFLARFFFCWPTSSQGKRLFKEAPEVWHHLDAFNECIGGLLETPPSLDAEGQLAPLMMSFAPEAKAAWIKFHDAIESELATGRELHDVRDCASKVADNAARLAALFQVFEHGIGATIELAAFEAAAPIAAWYLHESRRFFGELSASPQQVAAVKLSTWLVDYCLRENVTVVPVARVLQLGPSATRSAEELHYAMQVLSDADRARWVVEGRKKTIEVNPAILRRSA